MERALGKEVVNVEGLGKRASGERCCSDGLTFLARPRRRARRARRRRPGDLDPLLNILAGESKPDAGTVTWGRLRRRGLFPKDNNTYFVTDKRGLEWPRPVRAGH